MLHSIIFYYNKNLNRETNEKGGSSHLAEHARDKNWIGMSRD